MQDKELNENVDVSEETFETDPRVYEVGYLLVPTTKEEDVPGVYGSLKELVSSFGGQVISDDIPVMITLAYTMEKVIQNVHHKYDSAYFGWIKFFMDPGKILELKKKLDLDPNIIRFLTLKTVKENTIASKRFIKSDMRKRTPIVGKTEDGPKAEEDTTINKEEIDKEIEAMVAN